MPKIIAPPERDKNAITTASGLILPPRYAGTELAAAKESSSLIGKMFGGVGGHFQKGFNGGTEIDRDNNTLIVCWPQKGSGIDDFVMGEIVDGNIANAGIAPVVSSLLSAAVMKQVAQAANADITLTGRTSPTKKARDAISRWNDSPTGAVYGLTKMTYQLLVYNRGAPIATVPIIYKPQDWSEYGLKLHAMPGDGQNESEAVYHWLEVDWAVHGTPIPYLPSPFDLEPTGNQEWPYWYRVRWDNKERWVLLHNTQIIPVLPGMSQRDGLGTSSSWLSTEQLSFYIIAQDGKAENIVNAPTTGFLGISGVDQTASEIKQQIISERKRSIAEGHMFDKAPTILISEDGNIDFKSFSFRDMSAWSNEDINRFEDRIATNFRMSLGELGISRSGVGYAAQAEVTRDQTADSGVGYALSLIGSALGAIYPRVSISINRPNDYARVRQLEDFDKLSSGISKLPEGTLTRPQILAMIENLVGIRVPDVEETVTTSPGSDDTTDIADDSQTQENQALHRAIEAMLYQAWLLKSFAPVEDVLAGEKGDVLFEAWYKGLQKQYRSVDIAKVVNEIRKREIETDDPEFVEKVAPIVKRYTKRLSKTLDRAATLAALLAIAIDGRLEAEAQAQAADVEMTPAQRRNVDAKVKADMNTRLDQLLVKATGKPAKDDRQDIEDQKVENVLDVNSYEVITALIWSVMLDDIEIPAIKAAYLALVDDSAATRADLITTVDGSRAYNNAFSRTGKTTGSAFKRWGRTVSQNPREKHLAIVGQVRPINDRFSTGDNWAGESFGCKCSITLLWE